MITEDVHEGKATSARGIATTTYPAQWSPSDFSAKPRITLALESNSTASDFALMCAYFASAGWPLLDPPIKRILLQE